MVIIARKNVPMMVLWKLLVAIAPCDWTQDDKEGKHRVKCTLPDPYDESCRRPNHIATYKTYRRLQRNSLEII